MEWTLPEERFNVWEEPSGWTTLTNEALPMVQGVISAFRYWARDESFRETPERSAVADPSLPLKDIVPPDGKLILTDLVEES